MDWAAYLEHLQTMLKKFDSATALNKEILICYFHNSLKPSIWAQSNKQSRDLVT